MSGPDEIRARVEQVLARYVDRGVTIEGATESTRLFDDLGINSARVIDIALDVEDAFSVEIDDHALDSVETLGDVLRVVRERLA